MNKKIACLLAFSAGTAFGGFVSWRLLKNKYEQFADEQIASVKERFRTEDTCYEVEPDCETTQYEALTSDYTSDIMDIHESIEIIKPEELGEIEEYDTTTLYYYEDDGVLVTLDDTVIDDVDGTVGSEFPEHFGEYEDDSVCVRNHELMRDYEILKDSRSYADVVAARPSEVEE